MSKYFIALVLFTVPFMVSATDNVTICHATGSGWVQLSVDPSSINGFGNGDHNTSGHQNGRDIIPPGSWDFNGRNWDTEGQAVWNNGCVEPPPPPTPEEQCLLDEGFWNGEECEEIPECEEGDTYNEETNECEEPEVEVCPEGQVGTPPNCSTPEPEVCPEGQTGTPPNCTETEEGGGGGSSDNDENDDDEDDGSSGGGGQYRCEVIGKELRYESEGGWGCYAPINMPTSVGGVGGEVPFVSLAEAPYTGFDGNWLLEYLKGNAIDYAVVAVLSFFGALLIVRLRKV